MAWHYLGAGLLTLVASSAIGAAEPMRQPFRLEVPEGFTIELAAGAPLVDRPIHADFDERGRLYVCESSGTNDNVKKQLAEQPHWIVRLEDTDGDGRFDKRTRFADKLMFPEGMLWFAGSIYVAAPPSIWKFTDTDDDGIADTREEWFAGKTLTGCANDLHGPYEGLDGWIYWCKGAFAEQSYDRPGKAPFKTRAAHIFRCRPDGTGIEPVMTGGMDNPVEVAFTPGGERIFTTTFFQHPGGGQRDGLIHAIYGGVYGKPHGVIDGHPRTGELMPPLTHLGAAAPSGLARYESGSFGPDYDGNLFAALFNLHKVTRHVLTPAGATFASRDEDFLVSDNFDFHPTDVLEDADGSLVVIDTGGWYKLCCPSSQLWKPEIPGGIYRVRRAGAAKIADPRGLAIDWARSLPEDVARLLADERPAVRRAAVHELARRGAKAIPAVTAVAHQSSSAAARTLAVWTLARIGTPEAQAAIRQTLGDRDETVRQAAIHAVSVARDADALPELIDVLGRRTAHNRRAAGEALGRLENPAAIAPLLAVAGEELDRTLEHSVTFALIELANPAETKAGLASANPRTRRAALLALDQMAGGGLQPESVAELVTSDDTLIRHTASWILARHTDWAASLAPWLARQLAADGLAGDEAHAYVDLLSRWAGDAGIQGLLAMRLSTEDTSAAERKTILEIMAHCELKSLPPAWAKPVADLISRGDELVPAAIAVVRSLPPDQKHANESISVLRTALLAAAANGRLPIGVRLEALVTLPGGIGEIEPATFAFVRENLAPDALVSQRVAAADVLAKARLGDAQLLALADSVRAAGPLEIEPLIAPYAKSRSGQVGRALIAALAQCAALTNLRLETLQETFKEYDGSVQEESQMLYKLLAAGAEARRSKIEQLIALVPQADAGRGHSVFNSQKAACFSCHAIGYRGGNIGPDLTKIGQIRTERDLLESIVFPSASFVRSYEPITVSTTSGQVFSGTIRQENSAELVLALNAKDTVRIARDEIDELVPGTVSIMPAGLDQQLSAEELADLVAFLRACK